MNDSANRGLITLMIIIGISIVILLIVPRNRTGREYSYTDANSYSASVSDAYQSRYNTSTRYNYMPSITIKRRVPRTATTQDYSYTTYSNPSEHYYEYTQPTYTNYYPDGCDASTTYSRTTGMYCNSY